MNIHAHHRFTPRQLTVRVTDALAMLGIGRTKLYALIGAGEIEIIKVGKLTLIPLDSLEAFIAQRRVKV